MRTIPKRMTLTWLLMCFPAGALWAQEGGFDVADANGDDKVDATEMKEYVSLRMTGFSQYDELFANLDEDGDGGLSGEEFANRMTAIQSLMNSDDSEEDEAEDEPAEIEEFVDRYEKMYAPRDPKIGSTLPDATGFDEAGNPFELKQTRGKYTVIVSGCLT